MIHYIEPFSREQNSALLHNISCCENPYSATSLAGSKHPRMASRSDVFDDMFNVCILNLDDNTRSVTGGVRLMPTTGPTLLREVWPHMLPHPEDFRSPNIWEATRFCVAQDSNATRKGNFVNRATLALSLAVMDFGAANGITQVIGVCEKQILRDVERLRRPCRGDIDRNRPQRRRNLLRHLVDRAELNTLGWARVFLGAAEPLVLAQAA